MNTAKTTFLRARASFLAAGLASLLGGCVIEAKIGDDPEAGSDTGDATESAESSTTYSPGYTSGAEPGTASASTTTTGANPGSVSVTSGADEDEAGDDEGPSESTGGLDQDAALELCGVEVMPPVPGGPHHTAGLMCDGGCFVEVESSVELDLFEHGECLCEAMGCGPAVGGSTSTGGAPGETDGGDPDGCGVPFGGDESFICGCEVCSVSVNSVDETWLDDQDDLSETCECLCGVAGCGMPT